MCIRDRAIAALLLFRKRQFEAQRRRFLQDDRNKGALEIYSYLLRLYRFRNKRLGSHGQLPQQLYQLVLKARFSQHMLTEQEHALLLDFADRLADETLKELSLFRRLEGRYIALLF